MANKSSLDNVLNSILAVGNSSRNQSYPPFIYDYAYNTVSGFLLTRIAELYPTSQSFLDISEPFLMHPVVATIDGYVPLPTDATTGESLVRNLLGIDVFVRPDLGGQCGELPTGIAQQEFTNNLQKAKCLRRPVQIVSPSEWAYRTTDQFDFPTYENPIGCYFGKQKVKICPYDISHVELLYFRNENIYKYGYITQPDDTYIFDPSTTIETEWQTNAFEYIYKGMVALYGVYTRDAVIRDWTVELRKLNLF